MRFENPNLLWFLLVIPPVLALFFWWGERRRRSLLTQFVESRLLAALTAGISPARRKFRFSLFILAVALLIISVARPQYGYDKVTVEQKGLDIVVAVDTSKSMLATDIAPSRLERAKLAALQLMQTARADRLGLEAFAGDAFLECPLTIDNTAFQQSVQELNVNSIPQGGTALAAAIDTAVKAFKENDHFKVLVLLTDGEDNDEGALAAAQAAAKAGLKIFTIGIGSAEGTLVRVPDGSGGTDYIRDAKGQVVKTKLNEALLQQIAETTGGFYLPLRGANTIDTLYTRGLEPLPKAEGQERMMRRYHEQFHWPLAAAMLLLLAEFLVPERKRKPASLNSDRPRLREREKRARRPGVAALLVLITLLGLAGKSSASPADALRAYKAGNYTNALNEFTRLAEVKTNDLRLVFNAGTAAYRATNFDLAQSLFEKSALSPDLKLQQMAFYNLGNTQFQLAKQAKDLDGLQEGLETAEKTYERAVNLNTNDADANFNLAFTKKTIEQIKAFREMMRRAKSEADTAVRRAEFHKALEIMAPLEKTIAAKQFKDFITKLKNIDEIENPQPAPQR
jgi:Ca-activated chloride channel family protein